MKSWTIREVLEWTAKDLSGRGIDSSRLDAEVLLAHVLGVDRLGLYLDLDRPLMDDERVAFRQLVLRRRQREPVAYLTGIKEFWSLSLTIPSEVLVPRPDTEVLIEEVLELIPGDGQGRRAVDVGSGSGCIGLALIAERPELYLLAVDLSAAAANATAANAAALNLADRVAVTVGDVLAPIGDSQVDLIVSNPPYIPSEELDQLEPEISRWEPRRALDGGDDGLTFYRRLIEDAPRVLSPDGALVLEVGHGDQARKVIEIMGPQWEVLRVRKDYGGTERVVVARFNANSASAADMP